MPTSGALAALRAAIGEIKDLQGANPKTLGSARKRAIARAIGRSSVVLLSSHFERYVYALNEELVTFVNAHISDSSRLPPELKLLHSRWPVDEMFETQWTNRNSQLASFVAADAWLWQPSTKGALQHGRLLAWMNSPKPENVRRYFRYWGVNDIFAAVTRTQQKKQALWLRIAGLVDKRNNIAHGDLNEQATWNDIRSHAATVLRFCDRVDRHISRIIGNLLGTVRPW